MRRKLFLLLGPALMGALAFSPVGLAQASAAPNPAQVHTAVARVLPQDRDDYYHRGDRYDYDRGNRYGWHRPGQWCDRGGMRHRGDGDWDDRGYNRYRWGNRYCRYR